VHFCLSFYYNFILVMKIHVIPVGLVCEVAVVTSKVEAFPKASPTGL
jgi:hypothetical protein